MTTGVNPRDRRRRAAELHREGLTLAEIGRRLGITRQAAFKLVKRAEKSASLADLPHDAGGANAPLRPPAADQSSRPGGADAPPIRVPTQVSLTGRVLDEVEAESEAAGDSWNARKWRDRP